MIRDLNANVLDDQVLLEIDQAALPANSCGLGEGTAWPTPEAQVPPPNPPNPPTPPTPPTPPGPCEAVVTVLFLHTQQVLDAGRDPVQLATMGLHALNEAIHSSAIPNTNLEVVSVGNVLLTSFDDNSPGADNSARTINTFLPTDPLTQTLRDQRRADIVILLQETDIYFLVDGVIDYNVVGLADVNSNVNSNEVYSVIEAGSVELNKILVHEVGHLFGCRHRGGGHQFANGYQICLNPNQFGACGDIKYTIMNPWVGSDTPLRFSNPDPSNLYMGVLVGADTANNALMISNTACPISQFRLPIFNAFISGPINVSSNSNTDYLYSSYYQNCSVGSVNYRWEISWDYGNTFSHLSFTEDAVLDGEDVPPQAPKGIVRLTAVCAGDSSVVLLDITNWSAQNLIDDSGQGQVVDGLNKKQLLNSGTGELIVYPNPTSSKLNIQFGIPLEGYVMINLISSEGRKASIYQGELVWPKDRFSFDVAYFPPGFYSLEVQSATTNLRTAIILTK